MKDKIKDLYCVNKEDVLEYLELNMHLSPHMQHVVDIVKQLDLPNLYEMFDFEKHPDEALVYNITALQECTFPTVSISIDRIYNIETIQGLRYSHDIIHSIPIVIVPMEWDYGYICKENIENIDEDEFYWSFNHFYGRED